ncbi:MAG: hypothetical protein AAFX01_04510 [Cyanobacteria bacterium J06638_28]
MQYSTVLSSTPVASAHCQAEELLRQGRYEDALQCFQQAAAELQAVALADNYVQQAVCLIHLERPQAALQMSDRAIALEAGHPQAWLFRAVALNRLGQFQASYKAYDRALGQRSRAAQSLRSVVKKRLVTLKSFLHGRLRGHVSLPRLN